LPPAEMRAAFPVLGNPANRNRSVSLTAAQFRYAFGNALSGRESAQLYDAWTIPAPGRPLFEAALANLTPHSAAKVNTRNSARGPLLLISGQKDHTVPDSVTPPRQPRTPPPVTHRHQAPPARAAPEYALLHSIATPPLQG